MEENNKPQNKFQTSIDLLNDAIGKEIATSLQYMYFHVRFEDAGYEYLSRTMRQISIAEMRHICLLYTSDAAAIHGAWGCRGGGGG